MIAPKILFEDEFILILDKPPGLVVDKSETQTENTLESWLEENFESLPERAGIVHRLDKDTSGVILVAKTQASLEKLQEQFAGRTTKKEYLSLVHGVIDEPGTVEGAIGRNPGNREKFVVLDDGKEATTEYEPVKQCQIPDDKFHIIFEEFNKIQLKKLDRSNYNQFTLVRCFPKTGRTHQIRVHLKHIGHPVVSDEKYAGKKINRLDRRWCPRQFLHAAKLGFNHPETNDWMEIESQLPEDLDKALKILDG